jgi:acyl-CoA thioesterase I
MNHFAILMGLLSSLAAAAPGLAATENVAKTHGNRILVLGDSLAVSPTRSDNFAAELQKRLDAQMPGWKVANEGMRGDTTSGGLRRIDRTLTPDTRILILELGANDGLRGVDVSTVEKNLAFIIERAQQKGIRVLLCGMETPPVRGWRYTVDFHGIFPRLSQKFDVPLVPFLLKGVALNADFNGQDGVHPNAAGAKRIGETVWPYLDAIVQQEIAQ